MEPVMEPKKTTLLGFVVAALAVLAFGELFGGPRSDGLIPKLWQAIGIFVAAWIYILWPTKK